MRSMLQWFAAVVLMVGLGIPAQADPFFFTTGNPDGLIGMASRPESADGSKIEIEAADDFILQQPTLLYAAIFTGLMPPNFTPADIGQVKVEIYRVFPNDSDTARTPNVPTRTNSPSDVEFDGELALQDGARTTADGSLSATFVVLQLQYPVANSVLNGINPLPNQTTGGDGPVSGWLTSFIVLFNTEFDLPPDHYFFVPQVEVLNGLGDFLWVSAPHNPPQFAGDLQAWIRNSNLDPDWLRVGTDIVGGTTFNGSFSLIGETLPGQ
ncbi:MAG TPA: hypothetical protein VKU02_16670 [Gemmataceae bacterium]|nr:hypothetical protein [Gemmataceae bacterium]